MPKLGWVKYRNSRAILGTAKNITISYKAGQWFASIQTEREVDIPKHPDTSMVGVDVGIAKFVTLSTGEIILPKNSFKSKAKKLARYQRAMARKQKFSKNWHKAKRKITKLHTKIAHIRQDFLHKTSTMLSKNHACIVMEDLKIKNMSKSSKGNSKKTGKNVKAKSGLNRAILDQGWFELKRQITYKQAWRGGMVLEIAPQYTSQKCSCCGFVAKYNRQSQALFKCSACDFELNADVNASRNILAAGHAVFACGEAVSPHGLEGESFLNQAAASLKQEPPGKLPRKRQQAGIPVL